MGDIIRDAHLSRAEVGKDAYRRFFLVSATSAAVAVIGEIVLWLTITHDRTWIEITVSWVTVACCLLCIVLFMAGFFRWHSKGLWLALPAVGALALPIYAIATIEMERNTCMNRPNHPSECMP